MNNQDIDLLQHIVNTVIGTLRTEVEKKNTCSVPVPPKLDTAQPTFTERLLQFLSTGPKNRVQLNTKFSHQANAKKLNEILADLETRKLVDRTIQVDGHYRKPVWCIAGQVSGAKKTKKRKDIETIIFEQLATGPKTQKDITYHICGVDRPKLTATLNALALRGEIAKIYACLPGSSRASAHWQLSKEQGKATKNTDKISTSKNHFKTYTLGA